MVSYVCVMMWLELGVMTRTITIPRVPGHYGNQSRGYFNGGRPLWPPAVPRLAARPSQSNPRGLGQRYWSVSVVTWPPKPGVSAVGVFKALQPNGLTYPIAWWPGASKATCGASEFGQSFKFCKSQSEKYLFFLNSGNKRNLGIHQALNEFRMTTIFSQTVDSKVHVMHISHIP